MSIPFHKLDNTLYKPEALAPEIHKICADAMQHKMAAVCIAPVWIPQVSKILRGSGVRTCSAISFPHGTSKSTIKAIESTSTIKDGAEEIEVVPFLPHLLKFDVDASRAELMEIVRAARSTRRDVFIKVIVEMGFFMQLDPERAERGAITACRAVRESGCDAIVSSSTPTTMSAIQLLKRHADALQIKANVAASALDLPQISDIVDRIGIENAAAIFDQPTT